MQGGGDWLPVHQIGGAPDEQAGRVVEAGVGEEEVVAHADGAGVGMVAAQNGISIDVGFGMGEAGLGGEGEGGERRMFRRSGGELAWRGQCTALGFAG